MACIQTTLLNVVGFGPRQVLVSPANAGYRAWRQLKHRPTASGTEPTRGALADDKCAWQVTFPLCESFRADCCSPKGPISAWMGRLPPKTKSVWRPLSGEDVIRAQSTGSTSASFSIPCASNSFRNLSPWVNICILDLLFRTLHGEPTWTSEHRTHMWTFHSKTVQILQHQRYLEPCLSSSSTLSEGAAMDCGQGSVHLCQLLPRQTLCLVSCGTLHCAQVLFVHLVRTMRVLSWCFYIPLLKRQM